MCNIRFVSDAALPCGHDFVVVEALGGQHPLIFIRESAVTPATLESVCIAVGALMTAIPNKRLQLARRGDPRS